MTKKLTLLFCLGLLSLTGLPATASAQTARMPVGTWKGAFADGSGSMTVVIQPNGSGMYQVAGGVTNVGTWTWQSTSPVGGIGTLHYRNAGIPSRGYYSFTWVNNNTVVLSDPWFRVTLKRQ